MATAESGEGRHRAGQRCERQSLLDHRRQAQQRIAADVDKAHATLHEGLAALEQLDHLQQGDDGDQGEQGPFPQLPGEIGGDRAAPHAGQ